MRNTPDARFMWSGRAGIWVTGPGSHRRVRVGAGPESCESPHKAVGTPDYDVTGGRASEVEQLDHLERS